MLAKHWPNAKRFEDVRKVGMRELQPVGKQSVDILCGGFPCQDVSDASRGRGGGIDGEQSGLWREFYRIADELLPNWIVVENVAGAAKYKWLPTVRRDLHVLGYDTTAIAIRGTDVGAPYARERIFVVACADRESESIGALNEQVACMQTNAGTMWNGWIAEPVSLRMDARVSDGLDRVRALGNAVSPQQAEVVGRLIMAAQGSRWLETVKAQAASGEDQ